MRNFVTDCGKITATNDENSLQTNRKSVHVAASVKRGVRVQNSKREENYVRT